MKKCSRYGKVTNNIAWRMRFACWITKATMNCKTYCFSATIIVIRRLLHVTLYVQGGSNMTGTDLCVNKPHCTAAAQCGLFTYKSVPVIFEPPCTLTILLNSSITGFDPLLDMISRSV